MAYVPFILGTLGDTGVHRHKKEPIFIFKTGYTLRASLSGTFLQRRKDVVNKYLEFGLDIVLCNWFNI